MTYDKFISESLAGGLIQKQKPSIDAVEKLLRRSAKDLLASKANLKIDEGIAYTVAYLAMLRAARSFMLLRGFRPSNGYQHRTVVQFVGEALGKQYAMIIERFDRMRRKRNIFTYEIDITISYTEAVEALRTAEEFARLIIEIVKKENPQANFKF
jgi:uncharacterized protein (UPF0332 family)